MKIISSNQNNVSCQHLNPRPRSLLGKGLLALLGGLLLQGHALAGSAPAGPSRPASPGYLEVFSATEETPGNEGSYYFPHTGYQIYDARGNAVRWIENHGNSVDEAPQKIALTPGTYTIWAQADKRGYVRVSVTIKAGRATTLNLEDHDDSQEMLAHFSGTAELPDNSG
jgi:hypothetical protein